MTSAKTSMDKLIARYVELTGITSPKLVAEDVGSTLYLFQPRAKLPRRLAP